MVTYRIPMRYRLRTYFRVGHQWFIVVEFDCMCIHMVMLSRRDGGLKYFDNVCNVDSLFSFTTFPHRVCWMLNNPVDHRLYYSELSNTLADQSRRRIGRFTRSDTAAVRLGSELSWIPCSCVYSTSTWVERITCLVNKSHMILHDVPHTIYEQTDNRI